MQIACSMYCLYVVLFAFALMFGTEPGTNAAGHPVLKPTDGGKVMNSCALVGSALAGLAAGLLWTSQGVL